MKKALSLSLCLGILLGCVTFAAPRSSAAMMSTIPNAADIPETKEKQQLLYSEDFESPDLDTSKTNADLIDELGWFGSVGADDSLSIISAGSGHAVSITAHTTRLDTVGIFRNNLLSGGDYILEYTVHLLGNFKADPERTFGFCSESATTMSSNSFAAWRYAMKEDGTSDHHLKINDTAVADRGISLPISPNGGSGTSLIGSSYRVRIVIDADFGVIVYLLNGDEATLVSATNSASSKLWKQYGGTLGSELYFHILSGITVSFDDIQVWTCKNTGDDIPMYLGHQVSAPNPSNNNHDIRFIAGVKELSADALGIEVTYHHLTVHGDTTSTTTVLLADTIYESITADFGNTSFSASAEFPYLMAIELSNIPAKKIVRYEIKPFTVYRDGEIENIVYGAKTNLTLDRGISSAVPAFPNRTLATTSIVCTNYFRQYYTGTGQESYDAYCASLTEKGYSLYAQNALDSSRYATYVSDRLMLHVYYIAHTNSTTVLITYKNLWTPYQTESYGTAAVTTPKLALMNMDYGYVESTKEYVGHNNGMGFVYTLEDGSYVIIDGGYAAEAKPLFEYLQKNNTRADGKILIRAWILTHPDGDHINCFVKFSSLYSGLVTLEYLVMQPSADLEPAWSNVKGCLPAYEKCQYLVPFAGQSMYFGTLKLDFFYTVEMYFPYDTSTDSNESSLAFKGTLDGVSVFFGGDIVYRAIYIVDSYYSDSLKSDFLQIPHHGLDGSKKLYDYVHPTYVFLCTHEKAADERWNQGRYNFKSYLSYLKSLGCVQGVYIADKQIQTFELNQYASSTD